MTGLLADYGFGVSVSGEEELENSDVWVLNSCTVKNPSEETFLTAIRKGKESGKKIVLVLMNF